MRTLLILIGFLFLSPKFGFSSDELSEKVRTLINLNNYIANDYPNAIQNGLIVDDFEYDEMIEFSSTLLEEYSKIGNTLNATDVERMTASFKELKEAINQKTAHSEILSITSTIKEVLVSYNLVSTSPETWPNIKEGQKLYNLYCTSCHGEKGLGDGPISQGLIPPPSNLTEAYYLSPFHTFNTMQLGIEGTSMAAMPQLSETEKWDIAFYVQTLSIGNELKSYDRKLVAQLLEVADLNKVSQLNNEKLLSLLGENGEKKLEALRFYSAGNDMEVSLMLTKSLLNKSMQAYISGNLAEAKNYALQAYFEGFEPVERKIIATNTALVRNVEAEMLAYRSIMNKENQLAQAESQLNKIYDLLDSVDTEQEAGNSFLFVFIATLSILIREGLEALLIIVAILSALRAMGAEDAKKYVHAGWITAVLVGVIGYFFTAKLIAMGAQSRELIEGFGALLAVAILLSVGLWLHDKSTAAKWQQYVKSKIQKSLNKGSFIAIGVLGFVVVFREAFESVIFLSALTVDGEISSKNGVMAGTFVSAILIITIGILIVKYSKKLPVHKVFKVSSIAMMVLAVILAGKGIKELQEAGFVSVHLAPFNFSFDLLGFYPTYETLAAQLIVLAISFAIARMNK